jgi:HSP20 family protein
MLAPLAIGQRKPSEDVMVERSQAAGWWPSVYEPIKKAGEAVAGWLAPRSDASVSTENYQINMELPGVAADDIDISMRDSTMIVRGGKRFENTEQDDNFFFSEREYGAFQRSFRLPPDAHADNIVADYRNGVLTITIPKRAVPAADVRKIPIRSS